MIQSVDRDHSITTPSNTLKPFLFHSIFIQNIPFHHHIPFLSDALFPEQSGIHIISPKSLHFLNLQTPNPSNSYFQHSQSINHSISPHRIRSDAGYPFTFSLLPLSAQLLPLHFVEGLDPPECGRERPALFGLDSRSLCGRVGGGCIGDGRCHLKPHGFPAGKHRAVCRVIGGGCFGVGMGRHPSFHSMWTSP